MKSGDSFEMPLNLFKTVFTINFFNYTETFWTAMKRKSLLSKTFYELQKGYEITPFWTDYFPVFKLPLSYFFNFGIVFPAFHRLSTHPVV